MVRSLARFDVEILNYLMGQYNASFILTVHHHLGDSDSDVRRRKKKKINIGNGPFFTVW